ncbi:putative RTX toxin domain protein, partial [Vibrio parahaemolyticus V-223/04]
QQIRPLSIKWISLQRALVQALKTLICRKQLLLMA